MARQKHLSQVRTWERRLKDGTWGVYEHEMGLLPLALRERIWAEAMCRGPQCNDPEPDTLAQIAVCLGTGKPDQWRR